MISSEGVGDAVRDGLRGANHSNSLAIARICNDADRPKPRPHTHEEIVNTFLNIVQQGVGQGQQRQGHPVGLQCLRCSLGLDSYYRRPLAIVTRVWC